MEETRILIVVKDAEARAAYEEALDNAVAYDIAGSFNEVLQMSTDNAYSGLIVDILTLIRSSKEEKAIAYDCINYYPCIRVKWDARHKSMSLIPLEESASTDTGGTLSCFIDTRCRPFTARTLRKHPRKELALSLLLSRSQEFPEERSAKSFTVNISEGGAFVYTLEPFSRGDVVWLRFLDLPDEPVRGVVCWRVQWGACRSIPGIGVMFDPISAEQQSRVKKMAKL
jgi:Tfp pilus assembly protein PilZ